MGAIHASRTCHSELQGHGNYPAGIKRLMELVGGTWGKISLEKV